AKPHLHTRAVILNRSVDELPQFGEIDDVVKPAVDVAFCKSEHRTVDIDVLAARQQWIEPRAEGNEPAYPARHFVSTRVRFDEPVQHLQQRGLACAIAADEAEALAACEFE